MGRMESLKRSCLDTDFIIDYLRKPSKPVKSIMESFERGRIQVYTTSMNTFEVWLGVCLAPKPEELAGETDELLSQLEIANFGYDASIEASRIMAELRRGGRAIEIRDLFIGTIAKINETPLITRNVKHYERIPELTILTPEEVANKLK